MNVLGYARVVLDAPPGSHTAEGSNPKPVIRQLAQLEVHLRALGEMTPAPTGGR
jgi:hypothetical protein